MPTDDPHRVEEGQGIGITAGLAAGFVHQAAQGEVRQQQAVELLLGVVDDARIALACGSDIWVS